MLILTRRTYETIVIDDDITLTILGINGGHVRFGIDAPKNIPVHREEIYKRIQKDKKDHLMKQLDQDKND